VNVIGSEFYVFDDMIMLCASNAELVIGFDPTVAIGIKYAIEGIGNCFISRCCFGFFLNREPYLAL
jgi:hypothetical protein